ncbi:MAG: tRNA (adenosine(37)-N6)-threonylcarbamoyltransferase complex dimerization subunit type 1 TsaB [Candidatus Marinimicrobia bacterium]|nr:tRNA (adenosine(37)-N6)-threonylcarbamoyltransferase complex dimerization subunit type 1 TsaB [Candidatus Neomarinimicrobiota bacterium]MBL7030357.1 tRNA (adenosine(37)-N6)-threonylcarbamoyltransferase complex dimerization subunit type 1 TsaB [Candidatus Neomarinimicrobiota bacterium]
MNILAIETSTDWCGIAFIQNEKCQYKIDKQIPRKHAEKLPEFYASLKDKIELDDINLDAIAVSIGPGSFTGLRVGLSFAKGIAYAKELPIVAVPTLQTMAANSGLTSDGFTVLLYSHSDIVFYQQFSIIQECIRAVSEEKACIWNDIEITGESAQYGCDKLLGDEIILSVPPTAEMTGILAEKNFDRWVKKTPYDLVPNYISSFTIGSKK